MFHPDLYVRTMEQVASDRPDLYFTLGDDFNISLEMADFFHGDRDRLNQSVVDGIYLNQRRYLGNMAHSTALFLVNGNHEEARRAFLGTPLHDVAIFAGRAPYAILPLAGARSLLHRRYRACTRYRVAERLLRLHVGRCIVCHNRSVLAFAGSGGQLRGRNGFGYLVDTPLQRYPSGME